MYKGIVKKQVSDGPRLKPQWDVYGAAMGCEDAARALELIPAQEVSQQHNFGIV